MNELELAISKMDFDFFGTGQHKIDTEVFLAKENAVLLDVRTKEEVDTIKIQLKHHCKVLEIPVNEVPERIAEIPKDKPVGVFCSAGVRCVIIFTYLRSKGFEHVRILTGGYAPLTEVVKPGKIYKKINA